MVPAVSLRRFPLPEIAILLLAAGLRLYALDWKPAHFDEGVNGYFVDLLKRTGMFVYDPTNYHGPLHMYLLFGAQTLLGREVWALRLPVALGGVAAVAMLLWGWRRLLPRPVCLGAGLLLALSPGAVFVSRYAIHETWLVLALLFFTVGVAEWWRFQSRRGVWWAWGGLALALLTKETWVAHLACFAIAAGVVAALQKVYPSDPPEAPEERMPQASWRDYLLAPFTALLAWAVFYAAFGLNPEGLVDFFRAFSAWFATGTGETGHNKAWWYWLDLIRQMEWIAAAALLGSVYYLFKGATVMRWLAAATFGTLAAYSIVAYKTPWCIVSFTWAYALLAADLAMRLSRQFGSVIPVLIVCLAGAHDGWRAWQLNFIRYDDPIEPYVYVQTRRSFRAVVNPLLEAARERPQLYGARGLAAVDSVHPVPWILGDFHNIAYYGKEFPDLNQNFDFLLVDKHHEAKVDLGPEFWRVEGPLRDGMEPVVAFFRRNQFPPPEPEEGP